GAVLGMGYLAIAMVFSASVMVIVPSMGVFLFHDHDFLMAMMMTAILHHRDMAAGRLADDHDLAGLRPHLFHHDDLGTLFHHHHGGRVHGPGPSPFRAYGHDATRDVLDHFDMAGNGSDGFGPVVSMRGGQAGRHQYGRQGQSEGF